MPKATFNIGEVIENLTFLERENIVGIRNRRGIFKCNCGNIFVAKLHSVKYGIVNSCGCIKNEVKSNNNCLSIPSFTDILTKNFWGKVAITANPDLCWNWQSYGSRYGTFTIKRKSYKSNRIAYFLHYKKDPEHLSVLHKCDNTKCCNPAHLLLGTHSDNMEDMRKKGRYNNQFTLNNK